MSGSKHTPGPWMTYRLTANAETNAYVSAPSDAGERTICRVEDGPVQTENALLIAAAPAMLEALEGIERIEGLNRWHDVCPSCEENESEGHLPECKLGNALAQARGDGVKP